MERARRSLAREYAAAVEGLEEPRDVLRASAGVWFSIVERDPATWVLLYGGDAVPLTGDLGEQLNSIQHANIDIYLSGVGVWLRPGSYASDVSRSDEHTSELQSLMRNSYAVLCLKKKT